MTNPAPTTEEREQLANAIIADLQAQYDSEMITEHDSGEELIRLSGAIAAVKDNFAARTAPDVRAMALTKTQRKELHWIADDLETAGRLTFARKLRSIAAKKDET